MISSPGEAGTVPAGLAEETMNRITTRRKRIPTNGLRPIVPDPSPTIPAPAVPSGPTGTDCPADLAEVAQRWEFLPPEVKAEVLRLIRKS